MGPGSRSDDRKARGANRQVLACREDRPLSRGQVVAPEVHGQVEARRQDSRGRRVALAARRECPGPERARRGGPLHVVAGRLALLAGTGPEALRKVERPGHLADLQVERGQQCGDAPFALHPRVHAARENSLATPPRRAGGGWPRLGFDSPTRMSAPPLRGVPFGALRPHPALPGWRGNAVRNAYARFEGLRSRRVGRRGCSSPSRTRPSRLVANGADPAVSHPQPVDAPVPVPTWPVDAASGLVAVPASLRIGPASDPGIGPASDPGMGPASDPESTQIPAWQAPPTQVLPLSFARFEHLPVAGWQVPAWWHSSVAAHVTGLPTHSPPRQASFLVATGGADCIGRRGGRLFWPLGLSIGRHGGHWGLLEEHQRARRPRRGVRIRSGKAERRPLRF